ncbi:SDH family Clp fold serine proteinase [Sulfobacillus thermosulfidooxidans]|uniref:SDH family Clp fold serine proteinase n=1 Tax=Sulfobacillus thermosulfidooxidans TaxID=28034 RepID=UPI0006B450EA|nr:ATP-dependent Clp protease proteolytic subunit [Sulfobacillus thermosulfidooxidans]
MAESSSQKINAHNIDLPPQSPLFHAENASRYDRQALIREYEERFACRLLVMVDIIGPWGITYLEDLIYDADPRQDIHVIISSPGGDGESAVRMARSLQSRCKELYILVPDQAKSAATLLALGAHKIVMGPTSDLGPVDPQLQISPDSNQFIAAKNIIAAVETAAQKIKEAPETFPLYTSLLSNVNALMVQQALAALGRTETILEEALKCNPDRKIEDVDSLKQTLKDQLVDLPKDHSATFGALDAKNAGLPVLILSTEDVQWQLIWRLWTKYFVLKHRIYEGARVSHVLGSWLSS